MAGGTIQRAKRVSDSICANNTAKCSKFGPRLGTVSPCFVARNDLVVKAHYRAQVSKGNHPV